MTVKRLPTGSFAVTCPTCKLVFTLTADQYRARMRRNKSKLIHCSADCKNHK